MVRALEDEMIVLLAARAAELRAGWHGLAGDSNDRIWAEGLATRVSTTAEEWSTLLRLARIRARQLVERCWKAIRTIARTLEAEDGLSGPAVREIVRLTK
jgi:hypothetical protein